MGWDTSIVKSSMSNFASNEVLWLISIQAFQMINIALWPLSQKKLLKK